MRRGARARLFALSSLLVVTVQLPVTRWAAARLTLRCSMASGLLLIAVGFTVVAAAGPGTAGLLPAGFVVLGLYNGALSSVSGLIVLVGSSVTGMLLDAGLPSAVRWLVPAVVPAVAVGPLPRR